MPTVDEIRQELVLNHGYKPEEVNAIKGKSKLTDVLEECKKADVDLDNMEPVQEANEVPPCPQDKEWTEYVLGHLNKDEFENGHPTVDGLLRIAESFCGEIIDISTDVVQTPCPENEKRATVAVTVEFTQRTFTKRYSDAADVYYGNTEKPYANHPVATATTRALGRVLRRALRLRKVITAEEHSNVLEDLQVDSLTNITSPQLKMLEMLGQKLNIDIVKLAEESEIKYNRVTDISYSDAQRLCKVLSSYQNTGTPDRLVGYDEHWKNRKVD